MPKIYFFIFLLFPIFTPILKAQKEEIVLNFHNQIISNLIASSVSYRDSINNISIEICDKAIRVAKKEKADSLLALAYKTQGVNYYILGASDSSKVYYNKAILKFEKLGNKVQIGKTLGNIGLVHYYDDEYAKALEFFLKEIEIFSEINYLTGMAPVYVNLGNISVSMNNLQRAEDYYILGLKHAEEDGNIKSKISCLNNMGAVYEKQNKLNKSIEHYETCLEIVLDIGNSVLEARLYFNLAFVYRRLGAFDKASIYLDKSFEIRKLRGDYDALLSIYNEKFELAFVKKQFAKAKQFVGTMKDLAQIHDDSAWLGDIYNASYKLHKEIGEYQLALEAYEKYGAINDSIQATINEERYDDLMVKYDMGQTKQKIELMTQKTQIQKLELAKKNAWLVVMIVIILLGIIAIVVSFRINKLKADHKLMSLDQKVLLSQMNPHFLFNALTAVQSLVLDKECDKAGLYLSELATLVRNVLEYSREDHISLRKELSTLEKYIDLQRLRFDFPLEFIFEIDDRIDLDEVNIPPMLTQPFIENSFVHGNLQNVENPEILIKLEIVEANFVTFSIQDNGIGILEAQKASMMKDKKSLALQIVRDRIQIYNYKSKYQMMFNVIDRKSIDKSLQGTLVRFTIPA